MLDADGWKQRLNVKTHTLGQQIDEAHLHGDFPLSSELLQRTTCRSLFVLDGNRNVSRRVFPRSRNNSCYGETRRFSTTGFLPGKHARFLCSTAVIAISSVLCLACAMCCSVVDSCALGFRLLYQLSSDFVFVSLSICVRYSVLATRRQRAQPVSASSTIERYLVQRRRDTALLRSIWSRQYNALSSFCIRQTHSMNEKVKYTKKTK